jgi:2-polyprenyl-3-methyl-5-hydroxy-6-metoxy-1,4-benzoquinol methylase
MVETTSARHGNKQKHESGNPIQRALIRHFHDTAAALVRSAVPKSILDVGCGEGYVLEALVEAGLEAELHGIDLSAEAIADARVRLGEAVNLRVEDAHALSRSEERFDLVMMLEVLEHIERPEDMLETLAQLTRRHVLLSVPWEPFFRGLNFLRGKHVRAWGNDPEHINHWGRRAFIELVTSRFSVLAAPFVFPWTMVLLERR